MTLVVALKCKDGVVFASESQATAQVGQNFVRYETIKIKELKNNKLWAASGDVNIAEKIERSLVAFQEDNPNFTLSDAELMQDFADGYSGVISDAIVRYRGIWGAAAPVQLDLPEVVIVAYENEQPKIWHINASGSYGCEQNDYHAIGNGSIYAIVMLRRFDLLDIDVETGSVIALKVLSEAIEVSGFGIGEPIHVWTTDNAGSHRKDQDEMTNLKATNKWVTEAEKEHFKIQVTKFRNLES